MGSKSIWNRLKKFLLPKIGTSKNRISMRVEILEDIIFDLINHRNETNLRLTEFNYEMKKINEIEKEYHEIANIKSEFDKYMNDFKMIEALAEKAKNAYDEYLNDLKDEINDVKETHSFPRRMASLEERITRLEISHNGSGKTISTTS